MKCAVCGLGSEDGEGLDAFVHAGGDVVGKTRNLSIGCVDGVPEPLLGAGLVAFEVEAGRGRPGWGGLLSNR